MYLLFWIEDVLFTTAYISLQNYKRICKLQSATIHFFQEEVYLGFSNGYLLVLPLNVWTHLERAERVCQKSILQEKYF